MYKKDAENLKKVRVFPQGLAVSGDELTSFVLFKDQKGVVSFPVWCPALPYGLIPEDSKTTLKNPYEFAHDLIERLNYKITECIFDGVEGDEQVASICIEKVPDNGGNAGSKEIKGCKIKNDPKAQLSFLESSLGQDPDFFRSVQKLSLKAFEALALCSPKKEIIFSATKAFIKKTRDVAVFEKKNPSGHIKTNAFLKSRQKYLM